MKKAIAIPFLLLANIVILAHAVIPHHHHDRIIVSVCDGLSVDDFEHNNCHNHNGDRHEHECQGNAEDCALNELFVRSNQSVASSSDFDFYDLVVECALLCHMLTPQTEICDYGCLHFEHKPYLLSVYTYYSTRSSGLRAPPYC